MAGNPGIHILLTRPRAHSTAFGDQLRHRFGTRIHVVLAPLLQITPISTALDLQDVAMLLFTSVNGVTGFAALCDRRDIPCLCVGQKTADVARAVGLTAVSAGGSANELLQLALAQTEPDGAFLYLRGRHAARDLVGDLVAAGLRARAAVVYDQQALPLTNAARALLDGKARVLLPLMSPRSAGLFASAAAGLDLGNTVAIAISEGAAKPLQGLGLAAIRVASRPTAAAVTQEIAATL